MTLGVLSGNSRGASDPVQTSRIKVHTAVCALFRERFLRALRSPARTQRETLSQILDANTGTWFGRRHGFGKVRSVQDYRAAVPIGSHEDVADSVRRIAAGKPDVLTRAPVDSLQLTSGSTTGRRRLVPSTVTYQRKVRAATLASQGRYGHRAVWGTQYGSSEGLVGIPHDDTDAHVPAVATSFLEFIPEEDWYGESPQTRLVTELDPGGRYEVVLTGWNGMYRHQLGDVVEVCGAFGGVPTFRVVSRRAGMLSAAREKTTEAQVVEAVTACATSLGAPLVDFVVDIDRSADPAGYRMWAEPAQRIGKPASLGAAFDAGLRSANPAYGPLRDRGEIGSPIVRLLPRETFRRFRRQREQAGGPAEQLKILHSSTDPAYVALFKQEAEADRNGGERSITLP